MEKDITSKWKKEKAGVAIILSDEIDFKPKKVKRNKSYFIVIKVSVY